MDSDLGLRQVRVELPQYDGARVRALINDHASNARVHVVRSRRAAARIVTDLAKAENNCS